jgi:23S rRNA pseudouridine2604 synthase
MDQEQVALNKFISSSGFCSRREADKLIEQARVTINDKLIVSAAYVYPGDVVAIDGEPLNKPKKRPIYIAFNKPEGVTSTTDVKDKSNIIYFIGHPKRIFPVGRLDKDSDGLIFLTNDGDIVNKILRASNNHEKEYIVTVDKAITPEFIKQMSNGVPVLGEMTKKCFVRQEGGRRFRIILTQGLNRQIRRMCEYLDYKVVELTRVRIMNVSLGNLPVGKWRYFTAPEVDKLNELVADSDKNYNRETQRVKGVVKEPKEPKESKETKPDKPIVQYIPKRKPSEEARKGSMKEFRSARTAKPGLPDASKKKMESEKQEAKRPAKKSWSSDSSRSTSRDTPKKSVKQDKQKGK